MPRSKLWLPNVSTSKPMRFIAITAGLSSKKLESGGAADVPDAGDIQRIELRVPVGHVQELDRDGILDVRGLSGHPELAADRTGGEVTPGGGHVRVFLVLGA